MIQAHRSLGKAFTMKAMEQQAQRDWSGCEIVEYDRLKLGGAPTVRGRRITPDAYVDNFNDGFSAQEIAGEIFDEPMEDVKAILRYAGKRVILRVLFDNSAPAKLRRTKPPQLP